MNFKVLLPFVLSSIFTIKSLAAPYKSNGNEDPQFTFYCDYGTGETDFSMINVPHDHKDITYKVTYYSRKLSPSVVNDVLSRAFDAWSAVTDLKFTKKNSGEADIVIKFVERDHGCQKAFDGPYGVLAHASMNYAHFDDSENWSTQMNSNVINLYSIAVHEIGHSLGLGHSVYKGSMMFPSYDPSDVIIKLHSDDIVGIQKLYGAKTTSGSRNNNSGSGGSGGGGVGKGSKGAWSECWTTGCQLNTWAVVGCEHYGMTETNKFSCSGGHKYTCCK